ncbi:MAG TPA: DUF58 domain-containing protein [Candidatus Flavonifractor merdigallinarum]|uniref:DUF58 domain-containing protein n=1 Tax=Candidatus Flavonifractor merdigallinarum TaxID=2838589 RepID=A0A9D2BY72_9FIRM|nr:DUF58 domain-containing protein [Candidatus Flavonifractor merdigallinarum]
MVRRRILYALALLGAVLLFLYWEVWISLFLLALVVALPLLSLAFSIPLARRLSPTLNPPESTPIRGGKAFLTLHVPAPGGLPVVRLTGRLVVRSPMTGARWVKRIRLSCDGSPAQFPFPLATEHCTLLLCRAERLRALDLLGIFALPLPTPVLETEVLVRPQSIEAGPIPPVLGQGGASLGLKPKLGGGCAEDYDLRDYRPGDPMRTVHWKLSAKRDELVVREMLVPRRPALVLTADHFGLPGQVDQMLDKLQALSLALLERRERHWIGWLHPVSGVPVLLPVEHPEGLTACLTRFLGESCPPTGRSALDFALSIPESDGPPRTFHVTAQLWQKEGKAV